MLARESNLGTCRLSFAPYTYQRWLAPEVDYGGEAGAGFVVAELVRMNRRIVDSEPITVVTHKEHCLAD